MIRRLQRRIRAFLCPRTTSLWCTGLTAAARLSSGLIKQTPDSIGYVELIYALQNSIEFGDVQNANGKFLKASLGGVTAAAAGAAKSMPDDFRVSITDAAGADAYPIS